MIVLDANVLIALLDGTDAHHEVVDAFVREHLADDLAASVLTVAEALVRPAGLDRASAAADALEQVGLRTLPIPEVSAVKLAEIRGATRLRMPDAVVVLTAEEADADLVTADAAVAKAAEARGLVVHRI